MAGLNSSTFSGTLPGMGKPAPAGRHLNGEQFGEAKKFPREFDMRETGGGKHARPYPPDTHGYPYPTANYQSTHSTGAKHAKPYDVRADISSSLGKQFAPKGKHHTRTVETPLNASGQPMSINEAVEAHARDQAMKNFMAKPRPMKPGDLPQEEGSLSVKNKKSSAGGHGMQKHKAFLHPSKHAGKLAETLKRVTSAA